MGTVLRELQLSHFRNYEEKKIKLGQQTVIVGMNGVGKTNIIEAVALLSLTTSWRTEKDSEVIQWEQPFCRVVSGDRELLVQRFPYLKRIRIDGVSKKVGEVVGTLPSVLFQPDDSALITGSPAYRRQAIDRLLCQVSPEYMRALSAIQKVLKQRNKLLKQIQDGEAGVVELDYWDEQLTVNAVVIQGARRELIPELELVVQNISAELIEKGDTIRIEYIESPRHMSEGGFLHHLKQNRQKEILNGSSLYGPHREDISFVWDEHLVSESMSRGQIRALVLAFKIAEVQFIEEKTEQEPILLLDDVFSEFDELRRQKVTELAEKYQTILTTTDIESLRLSDQVEVVTVQ